MVYVVDDDDAVRYSLGFLLKSAGLPISPHVSAQEFLTAYNAAQPSCLVLDICMPNMSGLELQRQLNLRRAIIPVVFITGHGDIPMAVEAMRGGAFDFLEKPFHDQELIDRVRRALERDAGNRDRQECAPHSGTLGVSHRSRTRSTAAGEHRQAQKVIAADLGVSRRTVEAHQGACDGEVGRPVTRPAGADSDGPGAPSLVRCQQRLSAASWILPRTRWSSSTIPGPSYSRVNRLRTCSAMMERISSAAR